MENGEEGKLTGENGGRLIMRKVERSKTLMSIESTERKSGENKRSLLSDSIGTTQMLMFTEETRKKNKNKI